MLRWRRALPRPGRTPRLPALLGGSAVALCLAAQVAVGTPAQATILTEPDSAAQAAQAQGYRTGIAVLDLTDGRYRGAGDDAGMFASESVVKVLIATQLLLDGHMDGATAATAYRMITASDDVAASSLYGLAGGDALLPRVAAHYGIAGLGAPPAVPGRWGMTQVSAQGLVHLYAALVGDPAVWPWLDDAMAHLSPVAADGMQQTFGVAAAAPGSAVKQGWGHDSLDRTGRAVTNSTGVAFDGKLAVAVLTEGPAGSYGRTIQQVVTAETQVLLSPQAPAAVPSASTARRPAATARTAPEHSPALRAAALGTLGAGLAVAGAFGGTRLGRGLRRRLTEARCRRRAGQVLRRHQRARRAAALRTGRTSAAIVRLPDGRLVRVSATPRPADGAPSAAVRRATTRPPAPDARTATARVAVPV